MIGVCKDCIGRWIYGAAGQKRHMCCCNPSLPHGKYPSNSLKECNCYKKANDHDMNIIRKHTRDKQK